MPFDATLLDTHLGQMHDDQAFTLSWDDGGGADDYTYNQVSMAAAGLQFLDQETAKSTSQVAAIQASDFTTLPAQGDKVTISGTVLRVLFVQDSPDGALERRLFLGAQYGARF